MNVRIAFFDTKPYDRDFFTRTNEKFGYDIIFFEDHLTMNNVSLTKEFDSVCVFVNDTINAEISMCLKDNGIKLIALRSAGYNNVDLKAVYGTIRVVRVPEYSPRAVAEYATALVLSLNRKTHRAYYRVRDNNFSIHGLMGFDMYGKTAGIIGTGKIGKAFIEILLGYGMNILAFDVYPDGTYAGEKRIEYVDLDALYAGADIISLHCPLTPDNLHMINDESIAKMKDGVMIINTGRGKLINTRSLINGLKTGKIGSAGLDVYEEETEYFFEDFSSSTITDDVLARLMTFPNVLVTSHQGFFTKEALTNIALTTLENIQSFFEEGKVRNEVCYQCGKETCQKKAAGKCF
ncbi:MAG: 2-hydroxyacid dehydrogenase [Chitinispirillia bacterium]|jgi:D-lactate dehydrogenase